MSNADPSQLPSCDLVMKGGITSGVVYPKLIARLADEYQFRSVGGTSAGAIAAAGCAAAEHGRQRGSNPNAFAELAKLPDQLGNPVGTGAGSMLFQLFRPAPALRDHFAVLVGALNRRDKIAAVGGALRSLLLKFWPLSLLALLAAVVVGAPLLKSIAPRLDAGPAIGWALAIVAIWLAWLGLATMLRKILTLKGAVALWLLASIASTAALLWLATNWGGKMFLLVTAAFAVAMPLCLVLAVALCVTRFAVTLLAGLHGNRWGLCSGHDDNADGPQPPLTDWLTGYFNTLAGMDPNGRPLTFGDLWGAPMEPVEAEPANTPTRDRRLDLQVMTTAVSQKMCYAIPFREGAGQFYYDRAEWAALFPPSVMAWLDQVSAVADAGQDAITRAGGVSLRRLPSGRYLPVVVAVRLSLSFPVLLSALPLYQIDYSMPDNVKNKRATRVWFSDGGLRATCRCISSMPRCRGGRPLRSISRTSTLRIASIPTRRPARRRDASSSPATRAVASSTGAAERRHADGPLRLSRRHRRDHAELARRDSVPVPGLSRPYRADQPAARRGRPQPQHAQAADRRIERRRRMRGGHADPAVSIQPDVDRRRLGESSRHPHADLPCADGRPGDGRELARSRLECGHPGRGRAKALHERSGVGGADVTGRPSRDGDRWSRTAGRALYSVQRRRGRGHK